MVVASVNQSASSCKGLEPLHNACFEYTSLIHLFLYHLIIQGVVRLTTHRLGLPAWWGRFPLGVPFERAKGTKTRLECLTKLKGNESNRKGKEGRMDICPPLITNE